MVALIPGGILWFNGRTTTLECQRLESIQVDCVSQVEWLGLLPLAKGLIQAEHRRSFRGRLDKEKITYGDGGWLLDFSPFLLFPGR